MAGHVVHPDRGQAAHQGQGLGKGEADQEEPTRPGPRVAATRSMSSRLVAASARAWSTTGRIISMCRREASSGTMPPKRAWISF